MNVKELNTEASLLEVDRPCACAAGGCKCCCYQSATFTSGGQDVGSIKETCYFWYVLYLFVCPLQHSFFICYTFCHWIVCGVPHVSCSCSRSSLFDFFSSVPEFHIFDHAGKGVYKLHQPVRLIVCFVGPSLFCCWFHPKTFVWLFFNVSLFHSLTKIYLSLKDLLWRHVRQLLRRGKSMLWQGMLQGPLPPLRLWAG